MTGEIEPKPDADALAKEAEIEAVMAGLRPLVAKMPWQAPGYSGDGPCTVVATYTHEKTKKTAVFVAEGTKRDGKAMIAPECKAILAFTEDEWLAFIGSAKDGEFDITEFNRADAQTSEAVRAEILANLRFATVDAEGYLLLPSAARALRAGAAALNQDRPGTV